MSLRRSILLIVGLMFLPSEAGAQAILQGGPWNAGRAPMYVGQGSGQAVVQDSGPAGGGQAGYGLNELLQTSRPGNGQTTAPFVGNGTGPYGTHECLYDAPTTNSTGYHYLCFDADYTGGYGGLTFGAGGGAAQIPFIMTINGSQYTPSTGALLLGPGQIAGNFTSSTTNAAAVNQVYAATSCPSFLTLYAPFANTTSAPTGTTLNIYDGSQCVPWATQNATAHTMALGTSAAGVTGLYIAGASSGVGELVGPSAAGTDTWTLPAATANLGYQVGAITSGHCLQASGTAGGFADAGVGCGATPGGSSGQVQYNNSSAFGGISGATSNGTALTVAQGDFILGSNSTGVDTLTTTNFGSSSYTTTIPANTGTLAELNLAQSWSALQKYPVGDFALVGSSTGYTLLESGLSGSSNNTLTLPTTASDTLAALGTVQTFSVLQSYSANLDLTSTAALTEIANASSTGTTVNKLAKLTGAPSTAVIAATTDTYGIVGIVVGGAGTTGNAQIARAGQASCVFDGATTAGDYVQISSSTGGDCHDSGAATYPTSGQVLGRVLSTNGSGGTYAMTVDTGTVASSGSGCTISGSQYQIVTVNSAGTGCTADANASVNAGALSLGASGTAGSVAMGNATSGTVTLQPVTGALGTVTASLPANSGTIAELNLAQTFTVQQNFSAAGSVGSPTLALTNCGSCGLLQPGSNELEWSVAGVDVFDFGFTQSSAWTFKAPVIAALSSGIAFTASSNSTQAFVASNIPTIASGASATYDNMYFVPETATISGSTNITTSTGFNYATLYQPTYSNSTITVTNAATLAIVNAPAASGGMTITNDYAFWVQAGLSNFAGQTEFTAVRTLASASGLALNDVYVPAETTTLTGTTTVTALSKTHLGQPTITDSSSVTVTTASTLTIDNAPTAGGSVTITNPWALNVVAGAVNIGGAPTIGGAITYGGVTLSNSVTGTGSMVLSAGPTLTGTATVATLVVGDGVTVKVRSSGASTVTASATTDYFFCLDPTSNAIALDLPSSPATGLTYLVKDCTGQAATHNITVTPASGNIDGSSTYVMSTAYQSVAVTYTGSQWSVN